MVICQYSKSISESIDTINERENQMLTLEVITQNNTYIVHEDDSGKRTIVESTHPDKQMMMDFFIGKEVTRLVVGHSMLTQYGHTSRVQQVIESDI
jgi:hypothetical protein